jgi:hypothetical protein
MDALQQILAWYLGLRAPRPGEGTSWRFDFHWPAPQWLMLISAFLVAAFVFGVYRRDGESLHWRNRSILIGLRVAVFALIFGMLTELCLTIERTGLPIVAVMVDTSSSMSLQDQYAGHSKGTQLIDELRKSTGREPNRLAIAQQLLTRNDGQMLRELQRAHQVRVYRFAEDATPLESEYLREEVANQSSQESLAAALLEIRTLLADGDQTRPAVATKKVLSDLRGVPPAAIVFFTDGVASISDNDKLSSIAETARRKGIQFHIVGIGSEIAAKDLNLFDTFVDEVAFIGDPIVFKAKVRSFGYSEKKILLRVRKIGERESLAQQELVAPPDGKMTSVELSYTSPVAGEFDFVLEVVEQPNETDLSNNSETRHVSIREEKIRVLLADSGPRYEFRFLKQLFERDKSIELSTLIQEADIEYAQEDRTAIPRFPVKKEELAKYDVLVLGDLVPDLLGNAALENIGEFVREKGGGVVMIAGTQFNPLAYSGTPLENILPFEMSGVRSPREANTDSFHATLTLDGQKGNNLFRLGNSEAESLLIWNEFPNFTWMVGLSKLKPGARVFAEHPTNVGTTGRLPIILMQQVAAGKVLYHATDETWRWRFRTGDLYYGRYWIQAIRNLSRSHMIGKDRTAELTVDQQVYQRGQPATFRVRFIDERFIPGDTTGVSVTVERKGEGRQTVKLSRVRELSRAFEGQLTRLSEGSYHGWISQPPLSEAPPSADFRVEAPQREMMSRGLDKPDLMLAAATTYGRVYTLDDADRLTSEIPRGTPIPLDADETIPLWSRWEFLGIITLLLTAEWLFRKQQKLL